MNGLNSLGWEIHDHLKKYRPKMFKQLKKEGQLNKYVLDKQHTTEAQLTFLETTGLYPHEARELVRDQIFPPSEEDVPDLGGTIKPYTD